MSAISFWYRPDRFPPRRAARFGAPPASSSTGRTNSFGWTPKPSRWGAPESPLLVTALGWRRCTTGFDRVAASTLLFVIGVDVLLDTFVGRTISVPAMATLVGGRTGGRHD